MVKGNYNIKLVYNFKAKNLIIAMEIIDKINNSGGLIRCNGLIMARTKAEGKGFRITVSALKGSAADDTIKATGGVLKAILTN